MTLAMPNDEDQDRRIKAKPASRFATFASARRNAVMDFWIEQRPGFGVGEECWHGRHHEIAEVFIFRRRVVKAVRTCSEVNAAQREQPAPLREARQAALLSAP